MDKKFIKLAEKELKSKFTMADLFSLYVRDNFDNKNIPFEQEEENNLELNSFELAKNDFTEDDMGLVTTQQGALENSMVSIEGRIVNSVLNKVTTNKFEDQQEIMNKTEQNAYEDELELALATFYGVIFVIFAKNLLNRRAKEFGLLTNFKLNKEIKDYIATISSKAAQSHINTVLNDLLITIKNQYDNNIKSELAKIVTDGRKVTDADLALARSKALTGASQQEIINAITNEYSDITKNRAKTIARTETNRAFTQSQYQADLQFLKQNNLTDKAFKKWVTRSTNPCPNCLELASRPPIPFKQNFADLGEELTAIYVEDGKTKVKKQLVNFEELSAGNAHVNCACRYILIIED